MVTASDMLVSPALNSVGKRLDEWMEMNKTKEASTEELLELSYDNGVSMAMVDQFSTLQNLYGTVKDLNDAENIKGVIRVFIIRVGELVKERSDDNMVKQALAFGADPKKYMEVVEILRGNSKQLP